MPYRKRTEPLPPARFFCVTCGEQIPEERVLRKAVTCSKEHAKDFKNMKRRLRDTDRCRLCNRPSSAQERAEFAQWRKEKKERETAARREERKKQKAGTAPIETPLEQHLGTVAV